VSKKICRTNWLIALGNALGVQRFFCLQIASSRSSRRVQCFHPYSALNFLELAMASPSKICLDYERNHCIKNSDIWSGW
jgi:hypothetical protein